MGEVCRIERHDNFQKQTYRNRCVIDSPNGALPLTVPVEKFDSPKCAMKDVRISDHGDWRHVHWHAIASSYYNTPYFEFYEDDFRPFYERKYDWLLDFNMSIMEKCCELAGLQPDIELTDEYVKEPAEGELDCRASISPKSDWGLDEAFRPTPYYQVFASKHGFLPNLSIADLLFNMGPESLLVLHKSIYRGGIVTK